ncbi:UNVERIFIED_CONTAM: Phytochrome A1, partial [Sesamum calycinum]
FEIEMLSSQSGKPSANSSKSGHGARVIAQTSIDAKLQAEFEESGSSFDYSSSVRVTSFSCEERRPRLSDATSAYLHQIQKGRLIQPFGCLLALDEKTFRVIAYSENAPKMLTMVNHAVPSIDNNSVLDFGSDIRTIFTAPSAAALQKALGFGEVSLLNPILVHCRTTRKPVYAIIHRVTGSLIIDIEPVRHQEVSMTTSGALQSYKLAAKAINRLQSLPSGSIQKLCDTMVQEVFELTGYDRVMAYKFHDDDHGEVFAEITKPGLEPYLGLHYPATDLPQAARFLFMKNKVRMICDCRANNVKVIQDERLPFDLTLCGSTLRAAHSCHLQYMENMNSIASLVMSVLVFAIHVNKELELENQKLEKNILRTQTLLFDMLLRDAPLGIVSKSPNVMDLVKCDGAALLYKNKKYKLGLTPTDFQIRDIVSWLEEYHGDSTGLTTDSLHDAGFPGALALGDVVCGIAAVKITDKDWLFWFRSHAAAEIHWGGAKHVPGEKDDGWKMHPRSSFQAFLEVVKRRSLPWKDYEMDAIHSLQLILRNAFKEAGAKESDTKEIHMKFNALKIDGIQELEAVTSEMVRLIETASVPILAVDAGGLVNGWNTKIADLTGLPVDEAVGRHLLSLIEDSFVDKVSAMLELALQGKEEKDIHFEIKTYGSRSKAGPISLVVNACASRDIMENVMGVCFIAQDITVQKSVMDKFTRIEGEYRSIVQNPNPLIPPIFGTDEFGWCSEWNIAMTKLSGWNREDVISKMLIGEVFGTHAACCRLKSEEAFVNLGVVLNNAVTGQDYEKIPFGFFSRSGKLSEQTAMKRSRVLDYVAKEIRNPLSGIIFTQKMMEGTHVDDEQKSLLQTSLNCQRQINKILDDTDFDSIMEGYLDLEMVEFELHDVLIASISQVMMKSISKGVMIVDDLAPNLSTETFYGDRLRLQQVLATFLLVSVNATLSGGQLGLAATLTKDSLGETVQLGHLEFRITHSGGGIAQELLNQMFGEVAEVSEDGINLFISRKLEGRFFKLSPSARIPFELRLKQTHFSEGVRTASGGSTAKMELNFAADSPPLHAIAAAKIAGVSLVTNPTLDAGSPPTLVLASGQRLHGALVVLRYIGRIGSLPDFYGRDAYQSSQNTFLVGNSLSIADVAVWVGLAGAGLRWESLRKSKKYQNLVRWFNSISAEYDAVLSEFVATYLGRRGSTKAATSKSKEPQSSSSRSTAVENGATETAGSKAFEVDLPHAEYFADRYKGQVIVRFDDTNPDKESNEFVDNLLKDIETLGIKYSAVTYTSDYFPQLMEMAEKLIKEGKAYVDDTPREKMQHERMEGIESRCRSNSVEENLKLWKEMIAGSERGLMCCVRGKLDMQDPNKSLRDPVYYRCNLTPHHRIGAKYKVYPTYDFCCPFVDAVEGITHALRSSEYHDRNDQYYRIQKDMGLRKVHIYEFSRLNMVYTLLSKRKLLWFVQNGKVEGWDDPRFPTVQGIVRRGLKIEALIQFILEQGASKNLNLMEWDKLWAINKKIIDPVCPRHTAVIEEKRALLILTDGPKDPFVRILAKHKKYEGAGEKAATYSNRLWIDYADAESISVNEELEGVLHLEGNVKKTKLKLTWLPDTSELVRLTLVDFDYLITKKKLEEDEDFIDVVNPSTRTETSALGESDMRNLKRGDVIQLERKGYYRCDAPFIRPTKPIVLFAIPDGKQQTVAKGGKWAGWVGFGLGPNGSGLKWVGFNMDLNERVQNGLSCKWVGRVGGGKWAGWVGFGLGPNGSGLKWVGFNMDLNERVQNGLSCKWVGSGRGWQMGGLGRFGLGPNGSGLKWVGFNMDLNERVQNGLSCKWVGSGVANGRGWVGFGLGPNGSGLKWVGFNMDLNERVQNGLSCKWVGSGRVV